MKVTVSCTRQELMAILGIVAAMILVLAAVLLLQFSRIKPWIRVEGQVVAVEKEVHYDSGKMSPYRCSYVTCRYRVGDGNFSCRFRTLFPFRFRQGKTTPVFCSRLNPNLRVDPFLIEVCICAEVLLWIIAAFLLLFWKHAPALSIFC